MAVITAAAIATGGTLLAAKKSSDATKKAAKSAAQGQSNALGASTAATGQARGDVNRLFDEATQSRQQGFGNALDFTAGAIPQQIAPFQQGNLAAQQQLSRGLPQIQNALLGQPVDLSGFQGRQIGSPRDFQFDLSRFQPQPQQAA